MRSSRRSTAGVREGEAFEKGQPAGSRRFEIAHERAAVERGTHGNDGADVGVVCEQKEAWVSERERDERANSTRLERRRCCVGHDGRRTGESNLLVHPLQGKN